MTNQDIHNVFSKIKMGLTEDKNKKWYEYLFSTAVDLILLYIANNIIHWNFQFIAASFTDVLWAINLSLIVSIVANISLILYNHSWFKISSKIIVSFTALIAAITILTVFPFVINQFILIVGLKIIIILGIIASIVSIIFQIMRLIYLIATL